MLGRSSDKNLTEGQWLSFQGATGGQSPLFQAIDRVLGVQHSKAVQEYTGEMRQAMWGKLAFFLPAVVLEALIIRPPFSRALKVHW